MQWLFVIRRARQVLTVESILGKPRRPEIELSALNQSGLAAKEFIEAGGTRVEFALDSPFIELRAAEPREMSNLEVSQRLTPQRAAEPREMSNLEVSQRLTPQRAAEPQEGVVI